LSREVVKKVKVIRIDIDKCNGCRACEAACSSFHSEPRYARSNPSRARIRVISDPLRNIYIPVFAGQHAAAECMSRDRYIIGGKEYDECAFCRASCPSREIFREPDSRLPLKCDACESQPPLEEPMCVQWCLADALTYEERQEKVQEDTRPENLETAIEALVNQHGLEDVLKALARRIS
jgi:benzoyl-CoA reductase subunit BamC